MLQIKAPESETLKGMELELELEPLVKLAWKLCVNAVSLEQARHLGQHLSHIVSCRPSVRLLLDAFKLKQKGEV